MVYTASDTLHSIAPSSRGWLRDGILRHTFHLPVEDMTITLQDVTIILGLRIHGPPVTGTCDFDVSSLCQELLGVIPPSIELQGSVVSTRWLSQYLSTPLTDANEVTLEHSPPLFPPLTTRFDVDLYLQLG